MVSLFTKVLAMVQGKHEQQMRSIMTYHNSTARYGRKGPALDPSCV